MEYIEMDLLKLAALTFLLCQFTTVCICRQSSSLVKGFDGNNDFPNRIFGHDIAKRQVPWFKNCSTCGYGSKQIILSKGDKKIKKNKKSKSDVEIRYGSFKTSKAEKILSDARCKHSPSSVVCGILRKVLGGMRG